MKTLFKSFLFIICISHSGFSQGPGAAAVPFLLIGPSPALGRGESAAAVLPTDDSFGFHYNPAQLGFFSKNNNFAGQIYLKKMQWLPQFNFSDLYYKSYSLNGGYILKDFLDEGIDLNIGFGYMHTLLNLGEGIETDVEGNLGRRFNSSESFDAFSLGFSFEYYATFALGFTYKNINSDLAPEGISVGTETIDGTADASAYDVGLIISMPLISMENDYTIEGMNFISNAFLGTALLNNGGFISYGNSSNGDPLPNTLHLGVGFSLGLIKNFEHRSTKIVELKVASEASDLLIESHDYVSPLHSDINIIDNIFLGNSSDLIQVQNSITVNLLETIHLGFHKKKGSGFPKYVHNFSFMISSSGLLKFFDPELFESFGKYVDIRYARCEVNASNESPLDETKYQSLSIHLMHLIEY